MLTVQVLAASGSDQVGAKPLLLEAKKAFLRLSASSRILTTLVPAFP